MLVSGGGLSADGKEWLATKHSAFLMPEGALSMIFRAKFCAALKKAGLLAQVPRQVWKKDWVVNCKAAGQGRGVLNYLARYIFRVAISNNRIVKLEDGHVTFQYKESATDQTQSSTVPAEEFIRRFLQHVLPDRFIKVRYYGFLSPGNRHLLTRVRALLDASTIETTIPAQPPAVKEPTKARDAPRCPQCGSLLILVETLRPRSRLPP